MHEVTQLLSAVNRGDPQATGELLQLVYTELRTLAAQRLAREKPGQTLQPTALVHEAFLRLVGPGTNPQAWNGKNHFFAAAAEAMRRILIESARRKRAQKRGGDQPESSLRDLEFEPAAPVLGPSPEDVLALDEALAGLAAEDPGKAELVKLRYFTGLTVEEAAQVLGISRATAARHWDYARSWLFVALGGFSAKS